ncbi:MAG TPA: hypothetical protein VFQ41_04185 [Candidatus Angelobacter sp.]|nr:hypothetical protein [Candidatus Angelobacter sp.]
MAHFEMEHEVGTGNRPEDYNLYFQWGTYYYDEPDHDPEQGYRFIWRKPPEGKLQPARGQARIPNAETLFELLRKATEAGWFITCERND